ncbi:hybrid sensor histidine kinase/response regulator (plasmid) [Niveispirillum cyanobacteriorum]|uniref:histidine kinase n=1 Tax=Niveispirillum cyanobacteriorum TaxID=1612173 RepID=A0A2K9NJW1_9PROT|nr:hybrid sensor histidine kinase/response regulator [Niveispirillum cyanobacteriorum]GGE49259.1 histidine kinase [Niveispirillum cyanobacteriorum]
MMARLLPIFRGKPDLTGTMQHLTADSLAGERHLRVLIESVHDYAIYMVDPNGIVVSWNGGAQRFKGYRASEIIGQHFSRFFRAEDVRDGLPARVLATALTEGRFEAEGWRVRKDGGHFWASVVVEPVRDDDGTLIGFAKVTRDITERRQAQQALEEAREALFQAQKLETVGRLTGSVAHDFNNLLQVIGNSLELVSARLPPDLPDVQRHMATARSALETAGAVTQRLLAFARRQPLQPEAVDLNALARGMADLVRRSVGEDVLLRLDLTDDICSAWADPHQVESGILNLAVNARDAMPNGGTLTIATRMRHIDRAAAAANEVEEGEYASLSVADTGIGMSAEVLARAVEPFFTTKPVGHGTGLGLSQLYGFARQSGGFLTLDSREGYGTKVTLLLPCHTESAAEPAVEKGPAAEPEAPSSIYRLLLVEDEVLIRLVLAEALEEQGHVVHQAGNADAALDILSDHPDIQFLVTDVGLPGTNGRQLAELALGRWPGLKVLFLTGYIDRADTSRLPPGTQMLTKPTSIDALLAKLRQMAAG